MTNPTNRKTIGMTVSSEYPYKGAEVKRELTDFFQFLWNNNESRKVMKSYYKFDKIKVMIGQWG